MGLYKLFAGRYEQDDTSATLIEQFGEVESAGIDWDIYDFGTTRIEAIVKAKSSYNAYGRYDTHYGQRLALYGRDLHNPISGWIYDVEWLPGDRIRYSAYGPNLRMEDSYVVKRFASSDDIETTIQYLAGKLSISNGSNDGIVANTTTLDGWNPDFPQGSYTSDAIRELLAMSDSSSRIYDFRLIDEAITSTGLNQFIPYYTYRDSTSDPNWTVPRRDMARLRLSRNILDFASIATVWYGLVEGTATSVGGNTLIDTGATFIIDGVTPGDTITNLTRGGRTRVTTVNSDTNITHEGWKAKVRGICTSDGGTTSLIDADADFVNDGVVTGDTVKNLVDGSTGLIVGLTATTLTATMSGGFSNDTGERYEVYGPMVVGNDYSISTKYQSKNSEHQIDTGNLWNKEISVFERNMNATQAAQYAEALATVQPSQVQSFVISAPHIEDGNGARHPLWDVISSGGGYIQIRDLYPSISASNNALNALTTFWITGLSYDYITNSLTVDVDNLSKRLDARLRRAQILRVPQIRRY